MEEALGQGAWTYRGSHAEMNLAGVVKGKAQGGPTEEQAPR